LASERDVKEKDARVDHDEHQLVLYVEKEDGSYGTVLTGSYLARTYIDDLWDKVKTFEQECVEQLEKGLISPVGFYIRVKEMAPADVAARIGVSAAKVKKHMQPGHFVHMSVETARRYAEVFGIPVGGLFDIVVGEGQGVAGERRKTACPWVTITDLRKRNGNG
jgi:hypothetical protein